MILKPTKFRLPIKGHWGTKGLVGCWFNGDIGYIFDVSGNRRTGTLGSNVSRIAGKFGSALNFPDTAPNDDVKTSTSADLRLTSGTLIVWAKTSTVGNYVIIITQLNQAYSVSMSFGGTGRLRGQGLINWALKFNLTTTTAWPGECDNQWHQFVLSWGINEAVLYVDAKRLASSAGDMNMSWVVDPLVCIGSDGLGGSQWIGPVDHAIIWNPVLSATQIAQLYREPFCMFERERIELWSAAMAAGPAPPLTSSVFGSLLINGYSKRKLHKVGMFAQI